MEYLLLILIALSLSILLTALLYRNLISGVKKKQWVALDRFDDMIKKADSSKVLRIYNGVFHLALSLSCFMLGYLVSRQYLGTISAISCSLMSGIIPTMGLKILECVNAGKIRREAMNFFSTFSNYCSTGFDIFSAFRHSVPELNEPFKTVVSDMLKKYDERVDPIVCLESAAVALEAKELKSFFRTLIYQYVEGGDIVKLTSDFTEELSDLVDLDEKENMEDNALNYGIYLLVFVDLFILFSFLRSNQNGLVLGSVYGEIGLTIHFVLSIFLIISTFIKPRR